MENMRISIIAFGDSLTAGFQSPTRETPWYNETPYGRFLSEMSDSVCSVEVKGINGEMTDEMVYRFDRDVTEHHPDYVTILGGTNDIGWGIEPSKVSHNLEVMYKKALAVHITPVAITIPSIRGFDSLIYPRQELNRSIMEIAGKFEIPCVDMFTASAEQDVMRLAARYSNDGLHLSTAGYKLLAELLYNEICMSRT